VEVNTLKTDILTRKNTVKPIEQNNNGQKSYIKKTNQKRLGG